MAPAGSCCCRRRLHLSGWRSSCGGFHDCGAGGDLVSGGADGYAYGDGWAVVARAAGCWVSRPVMVRPMCFVRNCPTKCFGHRRGDRLKVLLWDGNGVRLCQRRLHQGRFIWPQANTPVWSLELAHWQWLIAGDGMASVTALPAGANRRAQSARPVTLDAGRPARRNAPSAPRVTRRRDPGAATRPRARQDATRLPLGLPQLRFRAGRSHHTLRLPDQPNWHVWPMPGANSTTCTPPIRARLLLKH